MTRLSPVFRTTAARVAVSTALVALSGALAGCTNLVGVDNSGWMYARLRGTVTRQSGQPVANAAIGISCVGKTAEPFGFTADADASGKFDTELNASDYFAPLDGGTYVCRVLTPYTGTPLVEKSISVPFASSQASRPVTEVSLVVP
jgi:hypothetical protein